MAEAITILPSLFFEGNDGPWSSFTIGVGLPPQEIRVLPASSQSLNWVVLQRTVNGSTYTGCNPQTSPDDCPEKRGMLYDSTNSSSFKVVPPPSGDRGFVLPFVPSESELPASEGYEGSGELGLDTLTIQNMPTLPAQLIAEYQTNTPFLGLLGLSARPSYPLTASDGYNSTLGTLWGTNQVPSQYWAYTAGAPYRGAGYYGSLTFGGYDKLRGNQNAVLAVPLSYPTQRELQVVISNMTISTDSATTTVARTGVRTFIDSTVPEIWLPTESCEAFESAFGLVWNETYSMYLVNDTHHDTLVAQNSSVQLVLSSGADDKATTVITLPYASFDLQAGYPHVNISDDSTVRYFPLKRADNSSQYILGRTFLQEAYIAVDYDNNKFYVSPATFPVQQTAVDVVTVYGPGRSKPAGLSTGATAGIAIGAVAAIAAIAVCVWLWFRRKSRQRRQRWSGVTKTASLGQLSAVRSPDNEVRVEYFNKGPLSSNGDDTRAELDAAGTAIGTPSERYELDAGSVRSRPSLLGRDHTSWGSGISSMHDRNRIYSFGKPSPGSPPIGTPSPPASPGGRHHARHTSIGEFFEMDSATPSTPPLRAASPPLWVDWRHHRHQSIDARGGFHEMGPTSPNGTQRPPLGSSPPVSVDGMHSRQQSDDTHEMGLSSPAARPPMRSSSPLSADGHSRQQSAESNGGLHEMGLRSPPAQPVAMTLPPLGGGEESHQRQQSAESRGDTHEMGLNSPPARPVAMTLPPLGGGEESHQRQPLGEADGETIEMRSLPR